MKQMAVGAKVLLVAAVIGWQQLVMVCSQNPVCQHTLDSGPCRKEILRYFYDSTQKACVQFIYGGCKGNANNFVTRCQCENTCLTDGSRKRRSVVEAAEEVSDDSTVSIQALSRCGSPSISPELPSCTALQARIVGGNVAKPGSWPWMVQITLDDRHYCSGVLVHPQYVLTAAQCMDMNDVSRYRFIVGKHKRESCNEPAVIEIEAETYTQHPDYNSVTMLNDIAVVKLKSSTPSDVNEIQPICSTCQGDAIPTTNCYIAGWGLTFNESVGYQRPEELNQACAPHRLTQTACDEMYVQRLGSGTSERVLENMMCAGFIGGGPDTCNGDAGTPLMCLTADGSGYELKGIASWGHDCGNALLGVYTETSKYINWIESFTGQLKGCGGDPGGSTSVHKCRVCSNITCLILISFVYLAVGKMCA